jgi:hypothetical protein
MKWIMIISFFILCNGLNAKFADNLGMELETGWIRSGYNDVAIPGNSGDKFSLSEDLKADDNVFFRLRLNYILSQKSELSLLYAPLKIESTGEFNKDILFAGESFSAAQLVNATYVFNSYRLTYKYRLFENKKWQIKLGFTAKIREAEIKLENSEKTANKTNVGFVPIIYFSSRYHFSDKVSLELSGDALAAPQGRAEDVLFALLYQISPKMETKIGYRLLEGGSDGDEVYTFALIHYAVLGLGFRF